MSFSQLQDISAAVERPDVAAYCIPTDFPESDGTLVSTTTCGSNICCSIAGWPRSMACFIRTSPSLAWVEKQFYALALQADKQLAAVLSSNSEVARWSTGHGCRSKFGSRTMAMVV